MGKPPHRRGMLERDMDHDAALYTSSSSFDRYIFDSAVYVNIAHVKALERLGVISNESAKRAVSSLSSLLKSDLSIPEEVEDVHIYIESILSKQVPEVGEMLALGKSRNDAVVASIKIKIKQRVYGLSLTLLDVVEAMVNRSITESNTIFPIYTHLQRAAPATFGFILQAYAVRLYKTVPQLEAVIEACEECPLGSAACAGTSVPLDREYLARLLGFSRISRNALEATASRDFLLQCLAALLTIAVILSSFAEELVLYSSEEFGFLRMPDEYLATSSIMPQKRNPVVAEIMRTKAAEVLGSLVAVTGMLVRQPSGYNIDLQQTTPKLWKAFDELDSSLKLLERVVKTVEVELSRALHSSMPPTAAIEIANHLTLNYGVSFRKAHEIAGGISRLVISRQLNSQSLKKLFDEKSVKIYLGVEEVLSIMDPLKTVERYAVEGSANPQYVRRFGMELLEELRKVKMRFLEGSERFSKTLQELLD